MATNLFLVINGDYEYTEIGLFDNETLLDSIKDTSHSTSSQLVPNIDAFLSRSNISLKDLNFIAANTGPGPFTTLRVILATVNGISFMIHKPLIAIDSIIGLLHEHASQDWPHTIALYNAFAQDVYYAYTREDGTVASGYSNIITLLELLKQTFPSSQLRFIGKGAQLYETEIHNVFNERAVVDANISYCSLQAMARQALDAWDNPEMHAHKLTPRYLKTPQYKKAI